MARPLDIHAFATALSAPAQRPAALGSTEDDLATFWAEYLGELADKLELGVLYLDSAHDTMRTVAETFSTPFLSAAALDADGVPTAWSQDLESRYDNLRAMGIEVVSWLREAQVGSRKVVLTDKTWGLEAMPGDPFSVQWDDKTKQLYMRPPEPPSDEVPSGTLGLAWYLVAAAVAIAAARLYLLYVAITGLYELIQKLIEQQEIDRIYKCMKEHSREDCERAQAAALEIKKANLTRKEVDQSRSRGDADAISSVLTTLAIVGGVGAAAYLGIKYVPVLIDKMDDRRHPSPA